MKYSSLLKLIFLLTSLDFGLAVSLAQSDHAFMTTHITIQGFYNINTNEFHRYWRPGQGIGLSVTLPFYQGQVMAEINSFRFLSRDPSITDFRAIYFGAGWNQVITILPRVTWSSGLALGNNFMVFDQGDASRGVKTESEFGLSLKIQISYFISSNWSLVGAVHRQHIFTYKRIRLTFVSMALSYSFKTPRWLKEFLR